MEEAWDEIKQHPSVTLTIDLFFIGIVFINPDFKIPQHLHQSDFNFTYLSRNNCIMIIGVIKRTISRNQGILTSRTYNNP